MRTVSVGICAADAVRLARGEEPEVGAVTVGRRRLPWAAAPTWYGGWGWGQDDLPSLRYHGQPVFASTRAARRVLRARPERLARPPDPAAGTRCSASMTRSQTPSCRPLPRIGASADPMQPDEPAELDPLAEPVELDLDELDEGAEPIEDDAIDESELPHDPDAKQ